MLEGKNIATYIDDNDAEVKAVKIKKISQRAEDGLFVIEPYGSATGPIYAEATGLVEETPEKGDWCVQLDDGNVIFMTDEEFNDKYTEE